jgi:GNAT superfamily N-acetyltransferase
MPHSIRTATTDDAGALAALAAVTFPLACPPSASPEDIAAHLANTLSDRHFQAYLADPDVTVLVIDADGGLRGYSLLVNRPATDPDVVSALKILPSVELSKCYVHPEHHGLGAAAELMNASLAAAAGPAGRASGWESTARMPGPSVSTKSPGSGRWAPSRSGWAAPWSTTSCWSAPSPDRAPRGVS